MLTKFLDPKNDIAFKRIFGTEKNKDILIHFINDMIKFKDNGPITEVVFLKTNQDPETANHKTSIVDILCKNEKGHQYIVEMQVAKFKGFEKRAQYYASKAYISQAHAGGEYSDLKEVIFLAIADFTMFPKKNGFKSDHIILDKDSYENDLKDFSFTFLELPKFKKTIDQLTDNIDKWMYFFKLAEDTSPDDLSKMIANDPIIAKAYQQLDRTYWNQTELLTYEQAEKRINDLHAVMMQKLDEGIAKGKEVGLVEGIAKGKEVGLVEGIAKGKEVGLAEGIEKERKKIVTTMYSKGIDAEAIATMMGLSLAEVNLLLSNVVKV